jgi:hypothetical protein
MRYWLVTHSEEAFNSNPRLIGFEEIVEGANQPINKHVSKIRKGDAIIYYCKGLGELKGVFRIKERVYNFENTPCWRKYPIQLKLDSLSLPKKKIELRCIVLNENLDLFKRLRNLKRLNVWGSSIQGRYGSIKELSENDFKIIKSYFD